MSVVPADRLDRIGVRVGARRGGRARAAMALVTFCLVATLATGCSDASSPGALEARGAWIPAPPPGAPAAAYMTIENGTDRGEEIVAASSPAARRVEIHQTRETEGVMRMEPLAAIPVPAGGKAELAPRGIHLMLMEPSALAVGATVALSLETGRGERLDVEAVVRAPGSSGPAEAGLDHDAHSGHH